MIDQRQERDHFDLEVPLILSLLAPPINLLLIHISGRHGRSFWWLGSNVDGEDQTVVVERFQRLLFDDEFGLALHAFVMVGPLECVIIVISNLMFPK